MTVVPANHRRSQRLFIQIPVIMEGKLADKSEFSEKVQTVVVNAHGALVESGLLLESSQHVLLRNARTNERIASEVKLVAPGESEKYNAALEFVSPNSELWHITFPPEDWLAYRLGSSKKPRFRKRRPGADFFSSPGGRFH